MEHNINIQILLEQIAVLDDKLAFERVFYIYFKKLHRFAVAIVKDRQAAEEVVSDVFVYLWKNRSKLLEIENLNNYIYIATKNMAIRRRTKLNATREFNVEEIAIEPAVLDANSPEQLFLNKELTRRYEAAINALPVRCQTIYRLAKQDGLRYKEIAAILNISVKTIDAQMAVALRKITQAVRFVTEIR
ncbi:MAG: RNA polymerase sigma-70 factor [Niabella sp.]|nr:RNA polymerase sigma-70 factor [Niabella sp.]